MQGFGTPHEAMKALDEGVAKGKFKSCAHLCYTLSGSAFEVIRYYYPACKNDSFVSADPWNQELRCPPIVVYSWTARHRLRRTIRFEYWNKTFIIVSDSGIE